MSRHVMRASGASDDDSEALSELELIMDRAKKLREDYVELMERASKIRGKNDGGNFREDLLRMSLKEVEASLGLESDVQGAEIDEEVVALEEYARLIERGEEIPLPPEGMYEQHIESAESFMERVEKGFTMFRNLVEGKMKVGMVMNDEDEWEDDLSLLTDIPERKSRHCPDIPQSAMAMYTFGERVLYILRRGYMSGSCASPIELLAMYELFSPEIQLETPWGCVKGQVQILEYCRGIDRASSAVRCSNLLMSFPKHVKGQTFVAEGICDMFATLPVPYWYEQYCRFTGKGLNPISPQEQIDKGISVPEILFPFNETDRNEPHWHEDPPIATAVDVCKASSLDGILSVNAEWLVGIRDTTVLSAENTPSLQGNKDIDIEAMTADDAEELLRGLFGDDFETVVQQLPEKLSLPPGIDPEYRDLFESNPSCISLSLSWYFDIDTELRCINKIRAVFNWVNMGVVHESDAFRVLAIEFGHDNIYSCNY